jgi:SnoaL-like polyketide cyclase
VTDPKTLVQRLVDDVINANNPDTLDDIATPALARTLHRAFDQFRAAFPDWHQQIIELVAEDDTVVARFRCTGTHLGPWQDLLPTSRTMSIDHHEHRRGLLLPRHRRPPRPRLGPRAHLDPPPTTPRHPHQPRRTRLTRRARRRLTRSVKIAVTVVLSLVAHGVTARPLTTRYVEDLDDAPRRPVSRSPHRG